MYLEGWERSAAVKDKKAENAKMVKIKSDTCHPVVMGNRGLREKTDARKTVKKPPGQTTQGPMEGERKSQINSGTWSLHVHSMSCGHGLQFE